MSLTQDPWQRTPDRKACRSAWPRPGQVGPSGVSVLLSICTTRLHLQQGGQVRLCSDNQITSGLCLGSGEVPNLFPRDELPGVLEEVRPASKQAGAGETPDQLYSFFLSRVKANLHVILCMSPAGSAFSRRCRMFPGTVPCHASCVHGAFGLINHALQVPAQH